MYPLTSEIKYNTPYFPMSRRDVEEIPNPLGEETVVLKNPKSYSVVPRMGKDITELENENFQSVYEEFIGNNIDGTEWEKLLTFPYNPWASCSRLTIYDNIAVNRRSVFANTEIYKKFQTAYKELTGSSIDWRNIPENLWKSLSTSQPLSVKEFINLPSNIRIAYFASHKSPDNVVLNKIKKRLVSYENKYGFTSENFYRKYHNSESLYEGTPEQVCDFLLWHGDYRRYLELKNAIR